MSAQHILSLISWEKGCNVNCEQGPCDRVARKASFDSLVTPFAWLVLEPHNTNKVHVNGGGQNTDPQSMDYCHGLPIWTILKWTMPLKLSDYG